MDLRVLTPEDVRRRAPDLVALQHAAYAVEAALIGDDRIPPLHETEAGLLAADVHWVATFDGDQLTGAVGYRIDGDVLDIDRLMIDPRHHRRGLGRALVAHLLPLAPITTVSTGRANRPARALYEALGFTHDGDIEPVPGLWVSQYVRSATPTFLPPGAPQQRSC